VRQGALDRGERGLDRVARAGTILEAIRSVPLATVETSAMARRRVEAGRLVTELEAVIADRSDSLLGLAAIHALAGLPGLRAGELLAELLLSDRAAVAQHAAWASRRRPGAAGLLEPMVAVLVGGGLAGLHAQANLVRWASYRPAAVVDALVARLASEAEPAVRRQIIETLGLTGSQQAMELLGRVAGDPSEETVVRAASIAAFGDHRAVPMPRALTTLAFGEHSLAAAVRRALADRDQRSRAASPMRGLHIAQVHLGASLDAQLVRAGMGDTGGVATLLVKLGGALAARPGLQRVTTIGRAGPADTDRSAAASRAHSFESVALDDDQGVSFADRWPALVAARRGLRRVLLADQPAGRRPDMVHLRMADVGSLAAAQAAAEVGLPTVFTLAADPHALIAARERTGELTRVTFAGEDDTLALWFRAALVERLAREADHVVLFPRQRLSEQLRELVDVDIEAHPARYTVVAEGVDVAPIRRALLDRRSAAAGPRAPRTGAVADLVGRIGQLPSVRRGLPIVLSVGRLNEVKGMARLVDAFLSDARLAARANLVIVGGALESPGPAESAELARIEAQLARRPHLRQAVVMLGHRPNGDVVELLAAARLGVNDSIGCGGAYACASRKEEFGLAIVEALAAGLPVVAPIAGAPSTYVEDGVTGRLVDTTDVAALARGVSEALDLASSPGRAARAMRTIARRYDITEMARQLSVVYEGALSNRAGRMAS
jgi:glycosyltransferase involved in cell wall biosynthesis